jgi:hypothetical protein
MKYSLTGSTLISNTNVKFYLILSAEIGDFTVLGI